MNKYYWFYLFIFILFDTSTALSQWEQVNKECNGRISGFIRNNDTLYVGIYEQGVFYSTDYGDTWNTINIPGLHTLSLDVIGRTIIVGSTDGIYYSSNFGSSWELIKYPDYQAFPALALIMVGNKILAGTSGRGIYSTTDLGLNWQNIVMGPYSLYFTNVNVLFKSYTNILASIYEEGIYSSNDYGANWVSANKGLTDEFVTCFAKNDSIIFAGTYNGGGLFFSRDSGKTWGAASGYNLYTNRFISLSVADKMLFASTDGSIYYITDNSNLYADHYNGDFWHEVNTNSISDPPIHENQFYCIATFGNYLFAGTSHGIWRCPLSQLTSVENIKVNLSKSFCLLQNYPNPFNPTTKIEYSIPKTSFVTLKVYDILGKEVAALANEEKTAGNYEVEFNGSCLSSGIYFYKLQAGNYFSVKKMILLK